MNYKKWFCMRKYILFLLFVLSFAQKSFCFNEKVSLVAPNNGKNFYFADDIIVQNSSDAIVRRVYDEHKNKYIVKQIVDDPCGEQFLLIRDLVGSHIGVVCDVPVNNVFLIPANFSAHIKHYNKRAATVHVFIAGTSLEEQLPNVLTQAFTLHQRFCNPDCPWQKKFPVHKNSQGLTRAIIESMTAHPDLPKIVAFDTFIGNADRSLSNIFYNKKENKFYGIDHAAAFNNKNLVKLASGRLQELIKTGYFKTCDNSIFMSLQVYKKSLQKLYNKITPEYVYSLLNTYGHDIYLPQQDCGQYIDNRIAYHTSAFASNYSYTKELLDLLGQIVD